MVIIVLLKLIRKLTTESIILKLIQHDLHYALNKSVVLETTEFSKSHDRQYELSFTRQTSKYPSSDLYVCLDCTRLLYFCFCLLHLFPFHLHAAPPTSYG